MKYVLKLLPALLILIASNSWANSKTDLTLINIDGIGFELLNEIKGNQQVVWWVEMGDKMVVATNPKSKSKLPAHITIIASQKNISITDLAFQVLGHYSYEGEKIHGKLDVIFASTGFQLVNIENVADKTQLFSHGLLLKFSKNKVLSYQYKNRKNSKALKANEQMQSLVDRVDKERWFSQVEYLASLDRMEHNDLVIAGEWLENKFSDLGLVISRVALNGRRGFNILGFKQGTTKPDEWYVVGAHIDSRNQKWDDTQPSPGAEDNASGCSGVLEMANVISNYDTQSSIMFICFTAEEYGLWGSADVITQINEDGNLGKIKGMLNLDMISYRMGSRNIAIAGTDTNTFESITTKVAGYGDIYSGIDWQVSYNMCCTDFLSFSSVGIPAVTSNQPDILNYFGYHQSNDLPENLDPLLGAGIVKANLATLADLAGIDFASNEPDYIFVNSFEN